VIVMIRYAFKANEKKSAKAYGLALRISRKNSTIVCRAINRRSLENGKKFLQDLINKKRSIDGKYYTKTATEILKIVESAEKNAEFKGLDTSKLIIHASAHKGFTFIRPRNLKRSGEKRKISNIQIVLST